MATMKTRTSFLPLADHDLLKCFVDFQGFKWCISRCGKRAVLMYGPADEWGDYTWDSARRAGMEVDIDRNASAYPNTHSGPQFAEIHAYLTALSLMNKSTPTSVTSPTKHDSGARLDPSDTVLTSEISIGDEHPDNACHGHA
jgi:hypothetical protein